MKKTIFAVVLSTMFVSAFAFASEPIKGCTNQKATNYNSLAVIDDGSCRYPTNGNPINVVQPWGITDNQAITQKLFLRAGEKDCPRWYFMGCIEVAKIENYQQKMINWYFGK